MISFELKYFRKGKPVSETISLPSSWNELSKKQLLYVAEYWEAWQLLAQNNMTLIKAKSLLFLKLMDGNKIWDYARRLYYIKQLSNESLYDLASLTNFIFDANALTKNPFPEVKIHFRTFYGPPDKLSGIRADEFSFADSMYLHYNTTKDTLFLDQLIAVLYRQGSEKNGDDKRDAFDKNRIEQTANYVSRLKHTEKHAILLFYIGCRTLIVSRYPEIFTKETEAAASKSTWIDVIVAMSGGKFGNFSETSTTDLSLIFKEIVNLKNPKK
ncbi:MAG: hypothetical protein A3F72_02920 [Bacteroidetes bacterium RIFCSPLOWO2_12_FULL_35_15]|nr:MAG: hypothetical protein A3F72_02920 [Bacteroidetes bacterium RIFCSPLOWO2_12_FULL_35_15]